jgi:hypothetical protein
VTAIALKRHRVPVDSLVAGARRRHHGAEGSALLAARELTAKVIRVDDFPQDLGAEEARVPTQVPTEAAPAVVHKVAA